MAIDKEVDGVCGILRLTFTRAFRPLNAKQWFGTSVSRPGCEKNRMTGNPGVV
jgi:hypothetical protein